jgi:tetratricopeptide (TPR) repeat protein
MILLRQLALLALLVLVLLPWQGRGQKPDLAKNETLEKAKETYLKGNFDEAYKLLEEAVKKDRNLPPARLLFARLLLQTQNMAANGKAVLEQAAAENPDHPEIYLSLASLALADGRLTETILSCQTVLALSGTDRWTAEQKKTLQREARIGLATAFEQRKDWTSARTHLTAWLEMEPKHGPARQRLARALFFLGRHDDANAELVAASKDEPSLEPPSIVMGRLWTLAGDLKKANEWMQKAVQKHAENARVHQAFGQWLLEQGRVPEAKIHADTALKLDPKLREAERLRGVIARHERDYATAERIFEALNRAAPADLFASNHLALVLVDQKDEHKRLRAAQLAEVNARQYPRSAEALGTLAWVYYQLGRKEDAEKLANASVSGGQATSDMVYLWAIFLNERGRADDARAALQKALEAPGVFFNRKEAEALLSQIKPKDKK